MCPNCLGMNIAPLPITILNLSNLRYMDAPLSMKGGQHIPSLLIVSS
jgi:hypothetical protein